MNRVIESTKAFADTSDVISFFCEAEVGHGIINEQDLEASEPMSQNDKLNEVKAEALLAKAEAVAPKKLQFFVPDESSENDMADSDNKNDDRKDDKKDDAMEVEKVLKRRAEQLKEPTERPVKRQRTALKKLGDYWGPKK